MIKHISFITNLSFSVFSTYFFDIRLKTYVQLITIDLIHSDGWHNKQPLLCDPSITESVWVNSLCQTITHIYNRVISSDCFHRQKVFYLFHGELQKITCKTSVVTLELCKEIVATKRHLSWSRQKIIKRQTIITRPLFQGA